MLRSLFIIGGSRLGHASSSAPSRSPFHSSPAAAPKVEPAPDQHRLGCIGLASWLAFADLTEHRLRRGVFTSIGALVEAFTAWAATWNDNPKPFVWHKAAEEIIEKSAVAEQPSTRSNPRRVTSTCLSQKEKRLL